MNKFGLEFYKDNSSNDGYYSTEQYIYKFDNGYGASVVCQRGFGRILTYGSEEKPWELAVLKYNGEDSDLCYETEITDDVLGYLTDEDVENYLKQIQALPKKVTA